jgi:hypothetical protein
MCLNVLLHKIEIIIIYFFTTTTTKWKQKQTI